MVKKLSCDHFDLTNGKTITFILLVFWWSLVFAFCLTVSVLSKEIPDPATTIAFEVAANAGNNVMVVLTIFNVPGKQVSKLLQEELSGGRYEIQWDGRDDSRRPLPSGIYLARLQVGNYSRVQKMMLVR
jgi:flagellar hook assembly protein FlgD